MQVFRARLGLCKISLHIAAGHPWTQQLQQGTRAAIRSCKRSRGPPRQAAGLPMTRLHELDGRMPLAEGGAIWPSRSRALCCWWLLREIEASRAKRSHIVVNTEEMKITWLLPSSKADQAALGAERSHTCCCEFAPNQGARGLPVPRSRWQQNHEIRLG